MTLPTGRFYGFQIGKQAQAHLKNENQFIAHEYQDKYNNPVFEDMKKRLDRENMFLLPVKARPGAERTLLKEVMNDGTYKIDIAAPAVDGKANAELVRFLAKELGLPKQNVQIVTGHMSTRKGLKITARSFG